jgi:hypothetical protein
MSRDVVTTVYQFSELSDEAKKRALEWLRNLEAEDCQPIDGLREDFETICDILGIYLKKNPRDGKTCIWYSGFGSQGDGAQFEGTYSYAKDACEKIREHAPEDTELHWIADRLDAFQKAHGGTLTATIVSEGRYCHEHANEITVECECEEDGETHLIHLAEAATKDALRRLMKWMYRSLEKEYNHLTGDEYLTEMIEANEYEFTEDGSHWKE